MSFIFTKPLSIEGVFSQYDTDGDGTISKKEAKVAKNIKIFEGFKIKKGMTLEKFEQENEIKYKKYELINSVIYEMKQQRMSLEQELILTIDLLLDAEQYGIKLSDEEKKLSYDKLKILIQSKKEKLEYDKLLRENNRKITQDLW